MHISSDLIALAGLGVLACEDCNGIFGLTAEGFLIRLAIFLAVMCFLGPVSTASPFSEAMDRLGVCASVPP